MKTLLCTFLLLASPAFAEITHPSWANDPIAPQPTLAPVREAEAEPAAERRVYVPYEPSSPGVTFEPRDGGITDGRGGLRGE